MVLFRRCNSLLARFSLIVICLSTSLMIILALTKYTRNRDQSSFRPTFSHSATHNHHDHSHHDHDRSHSISKDIIKKDPEFVERISSVETRRLLQQLQQQQRDVPTNPTVADQSKIGSRSISLYVHFDLKGAAPKISYFKVLFPLLHKWGAIGICMEYEDMFPFDGIVSAVNHKQAYTKEDIQQINQLAKDNQLDVMPLLQTYGHLEFLLKLKEFSNLRENIKYPQVITPCVNKTYTILFAMIDQYLNLHPDMRLFHIGHDEVYYFLSHPACEKFKRATGIQTQYELFAHHLGIIVGYIRKKRPNLDLLVWHDVLQNLNMEMVMKYHLKDIIPVLWSYREDVSVEGFVVGPQATVFGQFKSLWGASAFKGATHEVATIGDIRHYYENQASWVRQLNAYVPSRWGNFKGMLLTGWSRYDHFLSLCELLPYAIPALAFSLAAWQEPYISQPKTELFTNKQLLMHVQQQLGCTSELPLTIQEHFTKSVPKCTFPGAGVYESMISLSSLWSQVQETELFVDKYVTDLHIKYEYIHVKRGEECLERLTPTIAMLKNFISSFTKAMDEVFPPQVAVEWLETYFMRRFRQVNQRFEFIQRAVREQTAWLPRPIPNADKLETKRRR